MTDNTKEEAPPSYQEAIKTSVSAITEGSSSSYHQSFQRPPVQPPRPTQPSIPAQQYHPKPQVKPPPNSTPGNPPLPFKYPKNYKCRKCNNTGYKMKNGRTCKDCWEALAPRNSYNLVNNSFQPHYFGSTTYVPYTPPLPPGATNRAQLPPIRVPPGDPRLGGILCGRCRGSGMVRFLLDMELCPVCSGLGRVINVPQPFPQYPQYPQYPQHQQHQQFSYMPQPQGGPVPYQRTKNYADRKR
ncbi:hypothetical protein KGF56_003024 [Candida oxycetoniae]|uniref:Proline-rich protein HUA1 n=1 Tax=Candida oxycetoniae TaxID=497107 RepID=A0AAI9WXL4_9ASCO|nr:uncharacterized protein KGF56_003024 [Candida oxycetoniae]KAI3404124.2 hypothetical protein KGF56_003024 [Candida oxycetoniae]